MSVSPRIVLAGNPNAGKTTLFNELTGLRSQTGNYAGTTVARKQGTWILGEEKAAVFDLPGMYSMESASPEEEVAAEVLKGEDPRFPHPDLVVLVMDATNLERNLFLYTQVADSGHPILVVLTMMDRAHQEGLDIDVTALSNELGCKVVSVNVQKKTGLDALQEEVLGVFEWGEDHYPRPNVPTEDQKCGIGCRGCPFNGRFTWGEQIVSRVVSSRHAAPSRLTDSLDEVLTHSVLGILVFFLVMYGVFTVLFSLASVPMDLIDGVFASLGDWVGARLPEGDMNSLVVDGVIAGVGGVVIFLPQICLLFFLLAVLEDSGYLARAAFVMDRAMRKVGLPGTAFVPLLSGHACAIPAIMSTRVISDARDRLATILVLPLTSCSARIPVYVMVVALMFPDSPQKGALLMTGAYTLGILAALAVAFVLKKTLLPGESQPLLLELPVYKVPNLKNALLHTGEKAGQFLKQAGTIILLISIGIWVLSTYPKLEVEEGTPEENVQQLELEYSVAGRVGKFMEPALKPLGYDWKIGIGVLTSFAAREVIVSTLSIVYGLGEEGAEDEDSLLGALRASTREDGSPVFDTATCLSLLVFYVLAMQCLPTQAVTKAETGSWKWAGFQLGYMTVLAYVSALIVYQVARMLM